MEIGIAESEEKVSVRVLEFEAVSGIFAVAVLAPAAMETLMGVLGDVDDTIDTVVAAVGAVGKLRTMLLLADVEMP